MHRQTLHVVDPAAGIGLENDRTVDGCVRPDRLGRDAPERTPNPLRKDTRRSSSSISPDGRKARSVMSNPPARATAKAPRRGPLRTKPRVGAAVDPPACSAMTTTAPASGLFGGATPIASSPWLRGRSLASSGTGTGWRARLDPVLAPVEPHHLLAALDGDIGDAACDGEAFGVVGARPP